MKGETESFKEVVKKLDLVGPRDYITLYREWLMHHAPDCDSWSKEKLPIGHGEYLDVGLVFPYPTGTNWHILLQEYDDRENGGVTAHIARAYRTTVHWIKEIFDSHAVKGASRRKRRNKIEMALRSPPKSLKAAFDQDDGAEWREAAQLEFDTLTKMGVVSHGYTMDELAFAPV